MAKGFFLEVLGIFLKSLIYEKKLPMSLGNENQCLGIRLNENKTLVNRDKEKRLLLFRAWV